MGKHICTCTGTCRKKEGNALNEDWQCAMETSYGSTTPPVPDTEEVVVTEQDRQTAKWFANTFFPQVNPMVFETDLALTIARARHEAQQAGESRLRYVAASHPGIVKSLQRNQWMVTTHRDSFYRDTLSEAIDAAMGAMHPAAITSSEEGRDDID